MAPRDIIQEPISGMISSNQRSLKREDAPEFLVYASIGPLTAWDNRCYMTGCIMYETMQTTRILCTSTP